MSTEMVPCFVHTQLFVLNLKSLTEKHTEKNCFFCKILIYEYFMTPQVTSAMPVYAIHRSDLTMGFNINSA